jgi:acyl-coenzyme A synthetase/AMP-(fatty) acid ligase
VIPGRWYDTGFYGHESIADHLRIGASTYPDAAMHFVGGPAPTSIELGELYHRSQRLAGGLAALGVSPGDVVAIWVPNWLEGALTYQAAMMLGATVVPIVHIYGFIVRQSGARVLVMPDRWRNIDYRERFAAVTDVPALEHVVTIGADGPNGSVDWHRLAASDPCETLAPMHPDDRCLLVYTSGTTAEPKGVQHTTNTLVAEIRSTAAALGERRGVNLSAFPAGHIAGVLGLLRMFLLGTSAVVMDTWDPSLAARLVEHYRVTTTAGAPFHLASMMDEAERQGTDLSSLANYMVGAASVPASLVERAELVGIPVYRAYGSSEHPVITTGTPADRRFPPVWRGGRPGCPW